MHKRWQPPTTAETGKQTTARDFQVFRHWSNNAIAEMKVLRIAIGLFALASEVFAASLQQVSSFGTNPTGIQMYIYVPDKLATKPAVIVALHPCGGSGQEWYSATSLPSYADSLGFILIYPSTSHYSNCWDVNNPGSLTHGGSGDAHGVVSMVSYTLSKYSGDSSRVFVMGASSGAMMTNVMAGSYPDVFEAGAAYSGVAFACFYGSKGDPTPSGSNQTCAQGLQHTPQEWAQFVYNAYPGYVGRRTRMQVIHGLSDTLVVPQCGFEQLKQWSAVLGLSQTKTVTGSSVPEGSQYTEYVYGDGTELVGYFGQGVGHFAPPDPTVMLQFFGLTAGSTTTSSSAASSTSSPSKTSSTLSRSSSTSPSAGTVPQWGQCGGQGWTGGTICQSPYTCKASNTYYSQCI